MRTFVSIPTLRIACALDGPLLLPVRLNLGQYFALAGPLLPPVSLVHFLEQALEFSSEVWYLHLGRHEPPLATEDRQLRLGTDPQLLADLLGYDHLALGPHGSYRRFFHEYDFHTLA